MRMTTRAPLPLATFEGVLERITYANEEMGYTVARVTTAHDTDLLTVVGNLLGAQPGACGARRGRVVAEQLAEQIEVRRASTLPVR